jgi:hypothetical protein
MSIFSAIGSFVAGPFGALATTALSSVLGAAAASQRRKQAIKDQDNQFVRMRNAAQRAGFNPLTVMRNGGAQMFGSVPTFSKAAFMQDFVQQGYNAWTTHADNDPLKKYNQQVRELTIESMKSQIALDKAQTRGMIVPKLSNEALKIGVFGAPDKITSTPLVPGTGMTLDDIIDQTPPDVAVNKTSGGTYMSDRLGAALYPLKLPHGKGTIMVPWNPEDADIGAMIGGAFQYGALSAANQWGKFFDYIDEKRYDRIFKDGVARQRYPSVPQLK